MYEVLLMNMEDLQEQKLQLEINKLNADLDKLNNSWYKSADFWKSIVPPFLTTAAVLASLYFTIGRSVLDDEKRKLELQKEQLKLEIMQFEGVKIDIQKQISLSKYDEQTLIDKIAILSNQKKALDRKNYIIKKQSQYLLDKNKSLVASYSDDTAFYHKELNDTYEYAKRIRIEQDRVMDRDVRLASLLAENKFLKNKVQLTESDRLELSAERSGAAADELFNQARQSDKRAKEVLRNNDFKGKRKYKTAKQLQRWLELYFLGKQEID